jgi:histidine ammonia-lyase
MTAKTSTHGFPASAPEVVLGAHLGLDALVAVAAGAKVHVAPEASEKVRASRAAVDALLAQGDAAPAVYGINTGFGALAETRVQASDLAALQRNLIRSHATGVGADLSRREVRAIMALRAQVLALGHSGVRPIVLETLVAMLNADICPRIPEKGSVGASGDLAPLAHLALGLIGEGEVMLPGGGYEDAVTALARAGIAPITLAAKEGLALINGTQYMLAVGGLALAEARHLLDAADIIGAMSLEAQKGTSVPFDARLHLLRPHPGQIRVAERLRALLAESEIAKSHADCGKVQDAYSLRCMPQVHGASRDALEFVIAVVERELNAVTDNPSVFVEQGQMEVLSGGNFHGQPLAIAFDTAAMAVAELANISERRVEQLVNPSLSSGLRPFLAAGSGLHSGFMIAQVTSASLVAENKVLAHPSSVDSIPSSAGKEDHVSMGAVGAKKFREVVGNSATVLAIELLVAASGIDERRPLRTTRALEAVYARVREVAPVMTEDRVLYREIATLTDIVRSGSLEGIANI